jgi:hypothetical protein
MFPSPECVGRYELELLGEPEGGGHSGLAAATATAQQRAGELGGVRNWGDQGRDEAVAVVSRYLRVRVVDVRCVLLHMQLHERACTSKTDREERPGEGPVRTDGQVVMAMAMRWRWRGQLDEDEESLSRGSRVG